MIELVKGVLQFGGSELMMEMTILGLIFDWRDLQSAFGILWERPLGVG